MKLKLFCGCVATITSSSFFSGDKEEIVVSVSCCTAHNRTWREMMSGEEMLQFLFPSIKKVIWK